MQNYRTTILCAAIAFLCTLAPHRAVAADRPNIVFILADDLGYGDINAFGGDKCNIDTPHFDWLCAEGMKFTDAHVTERSRDRITQILQSQFRLEPATTDLKIVFFFPGRWICFPMPISVANNGRERSRRRKAGVPSTE
ncbi:MAG: sulfatase-like hydrolase/transferase [Pirellulaceae bacterium]